MATLFPLASCIYIPHSRNCLVAKWIYSVLHNKPELPFFAKLVCTALFGPKMEIQPLLQRFNQR
jgi:hypothetical protein